jgi:xanthine dehydrogenase accessory factor
MKDIYSTIFDSLKADGSFVLATIIRQGGSSSRGPGARMLINEDRSISGSVGGGDLEKAVIEASSNVFSSSSPMIYSSSLEMSCGGDVEVFLEPLSRDDTTCLNIFKEAADIVRRGGSGLLATALDPRLWQSGQAAIALFKPAGEAMGLHPGMQEAAKAIMNGMGSFLDRQRPEIVVCNDGEGGEVRFFIEPIISDPVLYVFGAGHVSSEVVPLARRVGFKVIVIDDRPEFSKHANFPDAEQVFNYAYDGVINNFPIGNASYIVIATRSHFCDEEVLSQALRTNARYVGMIGSRRKIATIFGNLQTQGFTTDDLVRVRSPIGLDIGAETPEEIALSIVSELVKVRAEG